jgi:hypothetical protein
MLMGSVIGVKTPLSRLAVYSEDALSSFNERKIQGIGWFTQEHMNEEIVPDAQTQ